MCCCCRVLGVTAVEWEMNICSVEALYNCSIVIIVVELCIMILFLTLSFGGDEGKEKKQEREDIMGKKW